MSTITFDFRHHYQRGERRESEQIAYQWDLGHVMEVFVPEDATYTIGYCFGDYEKTEDYAIDTKVQDPDGGYKLTAHIPNKYFERSGELRVYVVGSADDHIITTYEGFITIRGRLMPDDYVDDDPENGATQIIEVAREYATKSESFAVGGTGTRLGEDTDNAKYYLEQAEAVAESIPEDYSELSDDVDQLKNALSDAETAINAMEIVNNASGAIASFADGSNGLPVKGLTVYMEPIQAGSGDPSPDNVRPISGRTAVTVTRTGKNLLPAKFYSGVGYNGSVGTQYTLTDITDTFTEANGVFSKSVGAWGGAAMVSEKLPIGSYRLYVNLVASSLRVTGYVLDNTYTVKRQIELQGSGTTLTENKTVTLTNGESYIALALSSGTSGTISFGNPQIEVGSTATAYEPYTAQTVTIQLGQTVYGGTLDVTNGVLTVTHANITSYSGETLPGRWISSMDVYTAGGTPTTGAQVVYELAQPVTVQLTAQQLTTLLGQNNVWSDADSVSVDYVADTKLYIEQLTEPDSDMVADMNITSGNYFMVGNNLYLATANIANGAAIVVGTNCTRTNLAEALNAINA